MSEQTDLAKPITPIKFGPRKRLSDRIDEKKEAAQKILSELDPTKCENRIAGILDDSGSTSGDCWNNEILAFSKLLDQSDFKTTSYLLYKLNQTLVSNLTCDYDKLKSLLPRYSGGCTPLAQALEQVLKYDVKRVFAISDGIPDSPDACYKVAEQYRECGIILDTVFVKSSSYDLDKAKDCMRKIAAIGGGVFLSFDDYGNFSHAIAYLSPAHREDLNDKKVRLMLGSGE